MQCARRLLALMIGSYACRALAVGTFYILGVPENVSSVRLLWILLELESRWNRKAKLTSLLSSIH